MSGNSKCIPNSSICHFCGQQNELIDAHIIPRAFWFSLKDNPKEPLKMYSDANKFPKKSYIGPYDKEILCSSCDGFFGQFDDYASHLLLQREADFESYPGIPGDLLKTLPSYDYKKLKMFFLSLLYRAHITKNEYFKRIRIGPFEAKLLRLLKDDNPGTEEEFSVFLSKYEIKDGLRYSLDPYPTRIAGVNYYLFQLRNYHACIKVDSRSTPFYFDKIILKPNSSLLIMVRAFSDIIKSEHLKMIIPRLLKNHSGIQ